MLHYYLPSGVYKGQTNLIEYKDHCPGSLMAFMEVNEHDGCSKGGKKYQFSLLLCRFFWGSECEKPSAVQNNLFAKNSFVKSLESVH